MDVVFDEIHFEVCGFEELFCGVAVLGKEGHADAGGGMDFDALNGDAFRESSGETLHDFFGLTLGGEVLDDDDEFVAADTGYGFAGTGARAQAIGDGDE